MDDLTGIVLAGGRSRRMGRDKAFLDVGGVPMIRRVLDALASVCAEVLIVTKTPQAYEHLGVRVAHDDDPRQAALVGLCAGLRAAQTPVAFAAGCDLPFLSPAAVRYLAGLLPGWEAVVPRVEGRWHPLHAIYAAAATPGIEAALAASELRLGAALARLRVREVGTDDLAVVAPGLETLRNVNTEAEYRLLSSC